jgi:hypothetical protein
VIWGTDSVWYGSPQWQIEALRRLEIPEDMQKKHGFKPLGTATGPVKSAIFAGNAAKHYHLDASKAQASLGNDEISAMRANFAGHPSNLRYGYMAKS